jgi:MoaA/NifB/PqqE/SkfB family radical SAM enzyme
MGHDKADCDLDEPTAPVVSRHDGRLRFDYLAKLFNANNRAALRDYFSGYLNGPLVVDFDPTTACNFTCPECISANLLNKDKISAERIEELMHEFARAGVKGIVFIGGGEPLAHSCMPRPLRLAHDVGLEVGLTTNGSLIERHMEAIADCVAWTRVSMDAGTEATFATFRPNKIHRSFEKIVRAMERLARIKKGALGYSFLMMQRATGDQFVTNVSELAAACEIAKNIGCDYFEIKPMFDMDHALIPFAPQIEKIIDEQIAICRSMATPTFDVITTASVQHLRESFDPNQPKNYSFCPTMELRTTVTPSGIYPCAYHRGRSDKVLGTVFDGPFDEFWKSAERRRAAQNTNPSQDCHFFCARHRLNRVVLAMEELYGEGIDLLQYIRADKIDDSFF